jgi:hypothetical protein
MNLKILSAFLLFVLTGNSLKNPQVYRYANHLHETHKGWNKSLNNFAMSSGLLPLVSAYQYNAERQNGIYTKDRYIPNVYLDLSGGLLNMCLNKFGGIPLD